MGKIILVLVVLIMALTLLFGCTASGVDSNVNAPVIINSQTQANETINDVSTDLAGISNTLDQIDNTLTDANE